eukprot:jgi/Mesvir1/11431/Mv21400-RA.1
MFRQSLRCGFRNTRNGADEKTCIKGRQLRLYGRYKSETFDPTGPVKTVATTENAHCGTTKSRNLGTYEQCAKKGQLRLWGLYTKEDVDRARKRAGVTRAATQEVPLPPARKKRTRKPRRTLADEEASAALLMLQKAEERKRQVKEREERAKMRDTAKIFEAAPLDPPPRTKRSADRITRPFSEYKNPPSKLFSVTTQRTSAGPSVGPSAGPSTSARKTSATPTPAKTPEKAPTQTAKPAQADKGKSVETPPAAKPPSSKSQKAPTPLAKYPSLYVPDSLKTDVININPHRYPDNHPTYQFKIMNKIDVPFKFSHKLFGIHEVAYLRSTPADGNCLYHAVNLCKAWRERNPEVTYQTLLKLATKLREEARSRLDSLIRHAERKSERHPYIEYTDSALNDTKKRLSGNNFANSDIIALLADILRTDIYVISRVFDTSLKHDQFRFQIYESQVGVVRALRPLLIYHNGKKHYEALLPRDSRRTRADYGDHPLLDPKGVLINNLNIRIEKHDPPNTGMYTPPLDPYSDAPFRLGRVPYLNDKISPMFARVRRGVSSPPLPSPSP